jgi:hypothetical protein
MGVQQLDNLFSTVVRICSCGLIRVLGLGAKDVSTEQGSREDVSAGITIMPSPTAYFQSPSSLCSSLYVADQVSYPDRQPTKYNIACGCSVTRHAV